MNAPANAQWPPPPSRKPSLSLPKPERGRQAVGCLIYAAGMLLGALLMLVLFVVFPAAAGRGPATFVSMAWGALLAFPAALVYLTVPRLLDRYDPEPAYALLLALAWGAVAACGFSALINSTVEAVIGGQIGVLVGTVISAPLVEEAFKGVLVLGFFFFLRREFDGVVDGIIYATFVAIGFAAVENVIYYARAGLDSGGTLAVTFVMRGILAPWGHPLYTSMTGIGVGIARESTRPLIRFAGPVLGYGAAVFLHALWNGTAFFLGQTQVGGALFFLMLPLWFLFVGAFLLMVIFLVRRRGKIIRDRLLDEVALGLLTQRELELTVSAFGGLQAYFRRGRPGVQFVRAVARLALSKWHAERALKGNTRTVSMDFIAPLRAKIRSLRESGASPV